MAAIQMWLRNYYVMWRHNLMMRTPKETFSTSFPGLFPFELGRREKTLASAGHVPILHPKFLGVIN